MQWAQYAGYAILGLIGLKLLLSVLHQLRLRQFHNSTRKRALTLFNEELALLQSKHNDQKTDKLGWDGWRKFRVDRIVRENALIKSFYLVPHDAKPLPEFLAGQHLTFHLKVPNISKPVIRCYSLSDSAKNTDYYRISIKQLLAPPSEPYAPDGVASNFFHQQIEPGDILDVKAPSGKFYVDETEKTDIVLIAGGIGLTPSLAMLNTLADIDSKRNIWLFYGTFNGDERIMVNHLDTLRLSYPNIRVHYVYSQPTEADLATHKANIHHGYITTNLMFENGVKTDADFYICGPKPMMNIIVPGLEQAGIDSNRIHFESFGPASLAKAPKSQSSNTNQESFLVDFKVSQKKISWTPSEGTLLEAAENHGITIESGCRAGNCGTCLTAILNGEVNYIDECGMTIESGSCLPCIAIPKSDISINA